MFLRKAAPNAPEDSEARYTEYAAIVRRGSRKLWFAFIAQSVLMTLCLLFVIVVALKPTPVIVLDNESGGATWVQDTVTANLETRRIWVEAFAKDFITALIRIDATALDEDLTKALNMCTPLTRAAIIEQKFEAKRRLGFQGTDLKGFFVELEILIPPVGEVEVGDTIDLVAYGHQKFSRVFGEMQTPLDEWFYMDLRLQRVNRTPVQPHGLAVAEVAYKTFDSASKLEVEKLKVSKR